MPALLAADINSSSSTTGASLSESSLDLRPSTSKEAAKARAEKTKAKKGGKAPKVRAAITAAAAYIAEENVAMDDDFISSPAAVNGTRLPHVQPIIRMSTLVHAIPDVMAMYIADITGG